jgi:hypothetical protein
LPVEYRDELAVMHMKTLDSEDILDLVVFSKKASQRKKRSKKRSTRVHRYTRGSRR